MVYRTPEYHPAFEEYCEAIFELREDDVDVIQARIAERLDVSRPAVSEMIRRMEGQGLVAIDGARPVELGLLPPEDARALLARRLGAERIAAEPAAVDDIIARCAGLPLSLAVIAARAAIESQLSLAVLAEQLRDVFLDDLSGCERVVAERWRRRGAWARAQEFVAAFLQEQA